jgi:GntR family transcriptional repressor for pyruvate dehydrogenase complex
VSDIEPTLATPPRYRRVPVYASVQAKLREFVRHENLGPGDRLPPERQLARQLAVSRTSLRQALTALRVEGLVDIRHGHGIFLLRSADDTIPPIAADLATAHPELPALGEVRNALEALAAWGAALRRSDDDLGAMVAAVRTMEQEIADGSTGLRGDRAFHRAVLSAACNEVLTMLLDAIEEGSERIAEASLSRPGQPERSVAAHRLILDAILAREAHLARRLMSDHLELTGEISAPPER